MTIVYGQIESLKKVKSTLRQKGIDRFNSIRDINDFIKNHEIEKQQILTQVEQDLNSEIGTLQTEIIKYQKQYEDLKIEIKNKLNSRNNDLVNKYNHIESKNTNNPIRIIFNFIYQEILKLRIANLERNYDKMVHRYTNITETYLIDSVTMLDEYTTHRERVISDRSLPKTRLLEYTKNTVDDLYPLIAGAIGENLVVNELSKLPDNNILFNDFSMDFNPPIYNRNEKDRIFSIQIDHLLVTNAGVFILETKNWSKKSIESFDLRSPIEQIRRTSYAIFTILNSNRRESGVNIREHNWGEIEIPVKNVVVMINEKPKEKFKYVQVKTLAELNRYVTYFDPIFNDSEVENIAEYLKLIQN